MSQAGPNNVASNPSVATTFNEDSGSATPVANILNIFGGVGITTSGAGNTVTIDMDVPVTVPNGGTGRTSATAFAVICGGTTSTNPHQSVASVGTSGQALVSNGPGVLPTFQTVSSASLSPYIVGATKSDFTTISAAITQAVADGASATNQKNIYVKPGTYTENLALADGINIIGLDQEILNSSGIFANALVSIPGASLSAIVNGVATIADGASCKLQSIQLQTDTGTLFTFNTSLIGAGGATLFCQSCFLVTGISGGAGALYATLTQGSPVADNLNLSGCIIFDSQNAGMLFTTLSSAGQISLWNSSLRMSGNATDPGDGVLNLKAYYSNLVTGTITTGGTGGFQTVLLNYSNMQGNLTDTTSASSTLVGSYAGFNGTVTFLAGGGPVIDLEFSDISVLTPVITGTNNSRYLFCRGTGDGSLNMGPQTLMITAPAGSYSVLPTDYVIMVDTTAPHTITLPASPLYDQSYVIKDTTGTANANNITVTGNGNNIDGAATQIINVNYGSLTIVWFAGAGQWRII